MTSAIMRNLLNIVEDDDDYDKEKQMKQTIRDALHAIGFEVEDGVETPIYIENGLVEVDLYTPPTGFPISTLQTLSTMDIVDGDVYVDAGIESNLLIKFKYKVS